MSGEKTEQPTPKRLRKAREEGQVAKSADLSSAAAFLSLTAILLCIRWNRLMVFLKNQWLFQKKPTTGIKEMVSLLNEYIFIILIPVIVSGLITGLMQTGWLISFKSLRIKSERINPLNRIKQIFSKKTLFEFFKIIVKLFIILFFVFTSILAICYSLNSFTQLMVEYSPEILKGFALGFLKPILIFVIFLGIADYLYQRKSLLKELMMTKEEVKEEFKQDEGNPEIKGRRRQLHQEIAMHSIREAVKGASFVVINPDHIAIALRYNEKECNAPTVVAKGQDAIAREIIKVAMENHIPIMRNVPLAHALLRVEEGEEIPEELYHAVAEILIQLEKKR